MSAAWIAEETATAKFEDKRLNDRFAAILTAFGDRPNASIPAALNGHTELTAGYYFFDNPKVTQERILQPHYDATRKRCESQKVVLCAQDTTKLDFTRPKQQVAGALAVTYSARTEKTRPASKPFGKASNVPKISLTHGIYSDLKLPSDLCSTTSADAAFPAAIEQAIGIFIIGESQRRWVPAGIG